MLQDATADGCLKLFCLVDGEPTSNAFPLKIPTSYTVGELRKLIKDEKTPEFDDIAADKLTLWGVQIPDTDHDDPILLDNTIDKKKLRATAMLSKVFESELHDDTIHIIVQRPPAADPNTRPSLNINVEGNPPRTRAAPQDRCEQMANNGPHSLLGSAGQAPLNLQALQERNGQIASAAPPSSPGLASQILVNLRAPQSDCELLASSGPLAVGYARQVNIGAPQGGLEPTANSDPASPLCSASQAPFSLPAPHGPLPQFTQQSNGSSYDLAEAVNQGSEGPSLGIVNLEGGGESLALTCLRQAAKQGDINAQRELGFMYKNGHGVPVDHTKALEWFTKAGDQGDVDSLVILAFMKKNGQGCEKNMGRFFEYAGKAAGQVILDGHRFW